MSTLKVYGDLQFQAPSGPKTIGASSIYRQLLLSDLTIYVATDGDDNNDGLTPSSPLLTIQAGINKAVSYDLNGYNIKIQLADGTYATAQTLKNITGHGNIYIQGNESTPSNVLVNSNNVVFHANAVWGKWVIKDLKITSSTNVGIRSQYGSYIEFSNIDFGFCERQIVVARQGMIVCSGNYTISGGSTVHLSTYDGAHFQGHGATITFTTNPTNFTVSFTDATSGSKMKISNYNFTNSGFVTGQRYRARGNAVIDTDGKSTTYLPGTIDGSTTTGGQYV